MIIAVTGLPGSGKSFFAERLARRLGAAYHSSDQLRRRVLAEPGYSLEEKQRIYAALMQEVEHSLQSGCPGVVVDATFSQREYRAMLAEVGRKLGMPPRYIVLHADRATIRERIRHKRKDSDADFAVYEKLERSYELPDTDFLLLDSAKLDIETMLAKAMAYLERE